MGQPETKYAKCEVETNPAVGFKTAGDNAGDINETKGLLLMKQTGNGRLEISGAISGLNEDQQHALHIHDGAYNGTDCTSSGLHFNPE